MICMKIRGLHVLRFLRVRLIWNQNESNLYRPFGGKVVVLGGNFRQVFLVIRMGSIHDIVEAA
jgi:hypothetical protein